MERIKAWIRMFFGFSRTETNAFIILLPLIMVILFSEPVFRWWATRHSPDFSKEAHKLDSLISQLHWREPDSITHQKVISTAINFHPFDPNVLTEKEFVRLGLSAFISRRLVHFREKGGVFYKKEDLLKIYGIDSSWYARAKPWIAIASKVPEPKETFVVKKKVAEEFVDINTADSLQLIKVFGIGPSLSKRIRTFRARLGGFVSLEQLREVYGLDSSVVKEMKKKFFIANNYQPNKINLNTSDLKDLLKHPYIRWNEGQAILTYRLQHGNYASISDLHGIQLLTPAWIEKITPYLTLE